MYNFGFTRRFIYIHTKCQKKWKKIPSWLPWMGSLYGVRCGICSVQTTFALVEQPPLKPKPANNISLPDWKSRLSYSKNGTNLVNLSCGKVWTYSCTRLIHLKPVILGLYRWMFMRKNCNYVFKPESQNMAIRLTVHSRVWNLS